jgi:hypothetical protein
MDFLNELFGSEMGELKRHQKVMLSRPPDPSLTAEGHTHLFP